MHKHTCTDCGKVLAEGDFDCESDDKDHDYEQCEECVRKEVEKNKAASKMSIESCMVKISAACHGRRRPAHSLLR